MMVEKAKIHGMDGVRKALRRLPKEVRKREVQKALRPGAKLIQAAAKAIAPVGNDSFTKSVRGKQWSHVAGTLADSIAIRAEKKRFLLDTARLKVGVLSSRDINIGAHYWRFVEFGTSRQQAANGGRGFLVPAYESMKFAAAAAIKKALLKGVQRQARRVRTK